jgi:hypothetical protein
VLNRSDRSGPASGEAEVKYLDGDRQEAYASPEAVMQRRAGASV